MNRKIHMSYSALALLFLFGCQTGAGKVGTGPITLSPAVTNFYKNKYLKTAGPTLFVVSPNGQIANYMYCGGGTHECRNAGVSQRVLQACSDRAGTECLIFDELGFIMWDGPVKFSDD